jgi:hypothetical protein
MKTEHILFGLGVFVLVGSNVSLILSGWLDEFHSLPPKTGVYIMDLLLEFFPVALKTPSAKVVYDMIAGIALPASTAVIYEGSRRRGLHGGFNQMLLAAYWSIAQFVAIGFATPLFLALYTAKPVADPDYVHVGNFRVYGVLLGLLGTTILTPFMEAGLAKGQPNNSLLVGWLLYPVIVISLSVVLDKSKGTRPASPRFVQDFGYFMGFIVSALSHLRTVKLIADGNFHLDEITSNAPCVFLAFDLVGVLMSSYIWIQGDGRVSVFSYLWIAMLFGPGAHFSVLCAIRERAIDEKILATKRKA